MTGHVLPVVLTVLTALVWVAAWIYTRPSQSRPPGPVPRPARIAELERWHAIADERDVAAADADHTAGPALIVAAHGMRGEEAGARLRAGFRSGGMILPPGATITPWPESGESDWPESGGYVTFGRRGRP